MMKRFKDKDKKPSKKNRLPAKKKTCRFCADKKLTIDFKEGRLLQPFLTERGRIIPRRISGNCAYHQHVINVSVKQARILALLPFTATQAGWLSVA
ncbi:MAG: 30S ribosomal protein S18 [Deltaproteobacteria bacterium]|nr:30S ribosomal protein S18 [Deltaproteobacteria bacterium]